MKNFKSFLYSFFLIIVLIAPITTAKFANSEPSKGISNYFVHRIGAKCCDGTNSSATGRGACSHHGGVKYWKMSDGSKEYTGKCD